MSEYGAVFDRLAERWRVMENEHDRYHLDRARCGGVGDCSLMLASTGLERELLEALDAWRERSLS